MGNKQTKYSKIDITSLWAKIFAIMFWFVLNKMEFLLLYIVVMCLYDVTIHCLLLAIWCYTYCLCCLPATCRASVYTFQKFHFCGDLDCPDWVLAEITVLSRMVSDTRFPWQPEVKSEMALRLKMFYWHQSICLPTVMLVPQSEWLVNFDVSN